MPAWLPAPITPRVTPISKNVSKSPGTALWNNWMPAASETLVERMLMLLLVFGAVIAIGYGFSCFLDLAQNWAGFNAGIERMIQ